MSVASASAQVCAGVDGCVSTLTAHGAPVDSWVEDDTSELDHFELTEAALAYVAAFERRRGA